MEADRETGLAMSVLIRSKGGESFYGRRGSTRRMREDDGQYRLWQGIAKVALQQKVSGRPVCDARGTPLKYSSMLADGASISTIEKMANGNRPKAHLIPDSAYSAGWQRAFGRRKRA